MNGIENGIGNGGDPPGAPRVISRRRMLAWSLAAAAASGLGGVSAAALDLARRAATQQGTVVWASLTRPRDQLDLAWELVNVVRYRAGVGPGDRSVARIGVADPTQPAYLIVHFGPQSVAERAYFAVDPAYSNQGGDETALLTAPVPAAMAGASRLAFRLPAGGPPVPYTVDGLLDWTELALSVVPAAARTVAGRPGPQEPAATQTSLEVPWGLVLSPDDGAGWAHSRTPVTHGDRTELWHTRLGVRAEHGVDERDAAHRTVRAVWTPGYRAWPVAPPDDLGPNPPQRTSLRPRQRYEIVRLSSDHSMDEIIPGGSNTKPYRPRPIAVNRLMLTPLGAWLDADGSWDVPLRPGSVDLVFAVEQWLHRATMGRDHQVKVVEAGFLFPFGHRAALVTVTERAFEPVRDRTTPTPPPLAAINRQRMFVVVREPERGYPGSLPNQPYGGRAMPWRTVRITTSVTPNLAAPDGPNAEPRTGVPSGPSTSYGSAAFWPMVPGAGGPTDFLFAMEGEDAQGRRCPFTAPLIFVRGGLSDSVEDTKRIVDAYAASAPARRERPTGGQRVALTSLPGDSSYPVQAVTLGAAQPVPANATLDYRRQPRFFPTVTQLAVQLDAAEQVTGRAAAPAPSRISWHPGYLAGLDNPGRLFATLLDPIDLRFPADTVGGIATPDVRIAGLSALTGLVGGNLPDITVPTFDPTAFFAAAAPRLLGALPLTAILDTVDFGTLGQLPRLVRTELPDVIRTSYTWRPQVKADGDRIFEPLPGEHPLTITATATVRRGGGSPSVEVVGELTNVALNVFGVGDLGMLTLNFRTLRFTANTGMKATVHADLAGVRFHGVLEFINPLQDFLAKLGLVPPRTAPAAAGRRLAATDPPPNGPDISVTPAGIRAGYTLAVPKVPLGAFLLENIVLSSVVNIPFVGDPARVRFAFADRERPFLLTVAMFGGGGFCALQLGLDGFERFEAALEFGAKFALDLGVASGGVSAMAGIYFALGPTKGELSGYVRINGELRVLGLVSLGLEFYLGLSYETDTGAVSGSARLTVSVDVAFFSTSVTLGPIEKRFGGGTPAPRAAAAKRALASAVPPPPPAVGDLMSRSDWADPMSGYCALFAPAAFA